MKLFVAAICLLCFGNAFGQNKPIPKGEMSCVNEATGEVWSRLPSGHCYPKPVNVGKLQLICDWATDHWYCPTDKPIADSFGLLEPSGKVTVTPPPFDVPAKEWDGPDTHVANTCPPPDEKGIVGPCTAVYIEEKTHHVACEDKTRFLLRSEDGKHHCLKLVP